MVSRTMSQVVRDRLGRDYAQFFSAQVLDTVADESYNRPSKHKLIMEMRSIYEASKKMFEKPDLKQIQLELRRNAA